MNFNNDKLNTLYTKFEDTATEDQFTNFMWYYLDYVNIWTDYQSEWECHDDDEIHSSLQEIVNKYPHEYENLLIVGLEGFFEDPSQFDSQH
jgi:hypothetical protein